MWVVMTGQWERQYVVFYALTHVCFCHLHRVLYTEAGHVITFLQGESYGSLMAHWEILVSHVYCAEHFTWILFNPHNDHDCECYFFILAIFSVSLWIIPRTFSLTFYYENLQTYSKAERMVQGTPIYPPRFYSCYSSSIVVLLYI